PRALYAVPRDCRLDLALRRPLRHGLGHHEQLQLDRGGEEHQPRGRRAGHRRIPFCDRPRPRRRDPGGDFLQQILAPLRTLNPASPPRTSSTKGPEARPVPPLQRSGGTPAQPYRPMADINVTPMVDVMLVLLVVFMVTAPLLTVGVPVDLPQTNAQQLSEPK